MEQLVGVPEDARLQKELPSILAKDFSQADTQVLIDSLNYADLVNHESWRPDYNAVLNVMELAHREVMNSSSTDINQILEKANADVQALLVTYWQANP